MDIFCLLVLLSISHDAAPCFPQNSHIQRMGQCEPLQITVDLNEQRGESRFLQITHNLNSTRRSRKPAALWHVLSSIHWTMPKRLAILGIKKLGTTP
jgi:hypothetical protein